jgi:hypothetical protein
MSNAISGTGILLLAGDGATPENFVAIAELVSLKPPQLTRKEIEVTPHNTAVAMGEQSILGMLRKGTVTGTLNWLPSDATHSDAAGGMLGDMLTNVKRNWQIQFPPNGYPQWTFPARVQLFDPDDVKTDSALGIKFALTIDGAITMVNSA